MGTKTYSQDADGNLTSAGSMSFGYDSMSRINFDGVGSVSLDANGNRKSDPSGAYEYSYASNRMTSSPGGPVQIDAAGNTVADPVSNLILSYDAANRLKNISTQGGEAAYVYDYKGRRSAKTTAAGTTLFHYDAEDNLIAETDAQGAVLREYVRDGLVPLAQIDGNGVSYLHADHLGTPRYGTGATGQVVWSWESNAYGSTPPQIQSRTVNLRFPGQYFDTESGLHYNWNRYYDPKSGRYISSDPIGLAGGINTYGYVEGNPISLFDPDGNFALPVVTGAIGAVAGGIGNYLVQKYYQNKCDVDWRDVLNAAAWGAAAGAALPFAGGTMVGAGAIGAGANLGQYGTSMAWSNDGPSWQGVAWSSVMGAFSGGLGGTFTRVTWYGASQTAMPALARQAQTIRTLGANSGFANLSRNVVAGVAGSLPQETPSSINNCTCQR